MSKLTVSMVKAQDVRIDDKIIGDVAVGTVVSYANVVNGYAYVHIVNAATDELDCVRFVAETLVAVQRRAK